MHQAGLSDRVPSLFFVYQLIQIRASLGLQRHIGPPHLGLGVVHVRKNDFGSSLCRCQDFSPGRHHLRNDYPLRSELQLLTELAYNPPQPKAGLFQCSRCALNGLAQRSSLQIIRFSYDIEPTQEMIEVCKDKHGSEISHQSVVAGDASPLSGRGPSRRRLGYWQGSKWLRKVGCPLPWPSATAPNVLALLSC